MAASLCGDMTHNSRIKTVCVPYTTLELKKQNNTTNEEKTTTTTSQI